MCGFYWTEGLRGLGWAVDAVPTLKGGSTIGIPSPPAIWDPQDGSITTDTEKTAVGGGLTFVAHFASPGSGQLLDAIVDTGMDTVSLNLRDFLLNEAYDDTGWKRLNMSKRIFKLVRARFPLSGICKSCNKSFMSRNEDLDKALKEIQAAFEAHTCDGGSE